MRSSSIERNTNETSVNLALNLDGTGKSKIETKIPFFDHMLDQLVFHSAVDLSLIHISSPRDVEESRMPSSA